MTCNIHVASPSPFFSNQVNFFYNTTHFNIHVHVAGNLSVVTVGRKLFMEYVSNKLEKSF